METMSKPYVTLSQLRVFARVVEAGSFTKAAESLWMSQSAVSQAISGLESELGVALVERGRGGGSPTEVGRRVMVHAREILARIEQVRQEVAASVGLDVGSLRIGSFPSAAVGLLPDIIGSFGSRYPGIETVLFEGTYQEVRDWVLSGVVDVGIVPLAIEGRESLPLLTTEGLETVPLLADEMLVALPLGHPLRDTGGLSIERIAEEPFVVSRSGCGTLTREIFKSAGLAPRIRFEATDLETRLSMVKAGLGITIVPALALPADRTGLRLTSLDPSVRRHLALAVRSLESCSPAATAFVLEARNWSSSKALADFHARTTGSERPVTVAGD